MTPRAELRILAVLILSAALTACGEKKEAAVPPPPQEIAPDSVAEFCNMLVSEHAGPKGEIFVKGRSKPFWFASVRDTFAFTMLPEEPKDITAIYVTDMAKAKDWDHPGPGTWVAARKAVFVIESRKRGGMGEAEAVPFSDEAAARDFIARYGGRVVRFEEMPRDYILGGANAGAGPGKNMDMGPEMPMENAAPNAAAPPGNSDSPERR